MMFPKDSASSTIFPSGSDYQKAPPLAWRNLKGKQGIAREIRHDILTRRHRPDPVEWCPRGYAVVNVDIRGSWDSEGDLYIEGSQMGKLRLHWEGLNRTIADGGQVLMAMTWSNSSQHNHGATVLSACVAIPGWQRSSGQLL